VGSPFNDISLNKVAIIGVRTDPKPVYSLRNIYTNGAVVQADPHRPETSNPLEMEGRVSGVPLE